ncbi:MAG: transposase [Actinomycetia bacterium]|nr:transposase [Actinomycetes bacterium]
MHYFAPVLNETRPERVLGPSIINQLGLGFFTEDSLPWLRSSRPRRRASKKPGANHKGILAAIRLGINNGRIEGLNNKLRLIVRRGFGFHTATAALALVLLSWGPIKLHLPHERTPVHPHP